MSTLTDTVLTTGSRLVPLREAAVVLGVTPRHLRRVGIRAGVLRRVTPQGQWMIPESVIVGVLDGSPITPDM